MSGDDGHHPPVGAANIVRYCFIGFAIGESLGASALCIAGGIFTKIADIGSDLMKIVFNVKEDDPLATPASSPTAPATTPATRLGRPPTASRPTA